MIDRKHRLSVARQATLLSISRGAVYYLPQPVGAADLALMRRLDELHLEHPFVGARMLRRQLQSEGIQVGRRHVRTLMLRTGMEALCPPARHQQAPSGPQDLSPFAAPVGHHPSQSGRGAGHGAYPHGARFCLPHRRGVCGQPSGACAQGGHNDKRRATPGRL